MKMLRTVASLIALAAVACGETPDDPDQISPIGQVRGTISNPHSVAVGENLRTAIVWYRFEEGMLSARAVAQGIEVSPTLPAGFELTLTEAPPADAIMVLEAGSSHGKLRGAFGRVVAYEDLNGNGQLDVAKKGDAAYLDRVVGEIGGQDAFNAVIWIEPEDVAQAQSFVDTAGDYKPKAGYNLLIDEQGNGSDAHWASIDTPVNLVLNDSPESQMIMCADGTYEHGLAQPVPVPGTLPPEGPGPGGVWPDQDDPHLTCHVAVMPPVPAGEEPPIVDTYSYQSCTVDVSVCLVVEECVTSHWSKPSDPVKAVGWPCTGAAGSGGAGGAGGDGGDPPVESGGGVAGGASVAGGGGQTGDESGSSDN